MIYYTHRFTGGHDESRRLLRLALEEYTGDGRTADELMESLTEEGEHGKPVIPGFRGFSVSHSGSSWAVLICDHACGLDIQYERTCDIPLIAKRFYAPEEQDYVLGGSGDMEERFFRVWTRREALVKAWGLSVADSDLPSVIDVPVLINGTSCSIIDIEIPDATGMHAAACFTCDADRSALAMSELDI